MTYRVELARRAVRDLHRLFQQIDAADSAQARAWFNMLEAAIVSLEEKPGRCPATPEDRMLRHLLHGHGRNIYRVIFRIDERQALVTVLQVRLGARRPLEGP
ncbi:MAG TPA: type II toxin-antitoxin system RelE/ParE family toxin [Caulobacteraceae bacterium]|nr:type II toxin-antitoxin system RelE/ParE family toxin [Caulobacteraceae bacterium]